MSTPWVRAAVALGSNLGPREETLAAAVREITHLDRVRNLRAARPIETEPVGGPAGQGRYLNSAVVFETCLEPRALLAALQAIELRHGRVRTVADGPRTLDLDLLVCGDVQVNEAGLHLPHPRLQRRAFVLRPLAAIAPDLCIPGLHQTARELLLELERAEAQVLAR